MPQRRAASIASAVILAATAVGAALTVRHLGAGRIVDGVLAADPAWLAVALALMCLAMAGRAVSWRAILVAALPGAAIRLGAVLRATSIGVLLSATVPGRAGEPARAMVMTRHLPPSGDAGTALPLVLGTIVSQTLINLGALAGLGALAVVTSAAAVSWPAPSPTAVAIAAGVLAIVATASLAARRVRRDGRFRVVERAQRLLVQARTGLAVFRSPRRAVEAVAAQAGAWALQWLACWALLGAFGLGHVTGAAAAAAVLFAVNVTAAVPVTPSNIGVFQAACVAVLGVAYGVPAAQALGYGVVLQIVEVATAILMGAPALVGEGVVRHRAQAALALEGHAR